MFPRQDGGGWAALVAAAAGSLLAAETKSPPVVLVTSDCHYRQTDHPRGHHNDLNRATIEEMNRIDELEWPPELGGRKIGAPRGVLVLGDLIDDGDLAHGERQITREQWALFEADFGLDGTDGRLHWPVFEGWGNHDGPPEASVRHGFSVQAELRRRTRRRAEAGRLASVSENGLHHAWDWNGVHLVQLNLYPADRQHLSVKYSPVWHDPQMALAFLASNLVAQVGNSGRPVVLASHCGFDTDWWTADDWAALGAAAGRFNVVLYLYGHTGTGVRSFRPAGATLEWLCLNTGQTAVGFFVVEISAESLRAAYRRKDGLRFSPGADGRTTHTWDGRWRWDHCVRRILNR